ncbi:MAG: hypothetical protein WBB33_04125 [Candidatus Saccharimonadales bacterium]
MEPQLPKPQFSPEAAPIVKPTVQGGEVFHAPTQSSEIQAPIEQGRETREGLNDGPKGDPSGQPVFAPPPLPVIDATQAVAQATPAQDSSSSPAVAADEDLIEREWVEKAKKVVADNRHDPHAQDLAVGQLQADYLKKRYGKVIAMPSDR